MSNANNFLQNMGMQMPMFTAANQQTTTEDVDLHDIFADYFTEDNTVAAELLSNAQQQHQAQAFPNVLAVQQQNQQVQQQQVQTQQHQHQVQAVQQQLLAANAAAAQAQQQQQQQQQPQISLPTGQGIKTAWHTGSLPVMQRVATNNTNTQTSQPQAKRSRGEDLYLPSQQQQIQAQAQQLGGANLSGQQQQQNGINNNVTMTAQQQQHQQQMVMAQAASGVGALSGRLGFTLPNKIATPAAAHNPTHMMGQQQQQQQQQVNNTANTNAGGGTMINLPIGMGMKFGTGGNIITAQQEGAVGIGMHANVVGGGVGMINGNGIATNGVMNNTIAAAAGITNANASILSSNLNSNPHMAGQVAVTNMQYGMAPNPLHQMGMGLLDKGDVDDQMADERRLRNREHAKRSRVRKKFMLESLQEQVRGLQGENSNLRLLVQKHVPKDALKIIDDCCSKSVLFDTTGDFGGEGLDGSDAAPQDVNKEGGADSTPLLRSDFSLIESLTSGQQNFVLSDPRLPDNPIVFASPGFYVLTGYTREQVLGRNCRFLQGAKTDRNAIEVIRTAVANGTDATVCLLNYKADGTPFWNQLFVAALRDADNCIVNYVGVQTMIEPNAGASALEDKVNAAHPISIGVDDDDENGKDAKKVIHERVS